MKILMTADTVGGVWTYALELARALAPHGVEITIATMGEPLTDAQWNETRALSNVQVAESTYRLEWMHDPWRDVDAAGQWLLGLANELKPDIVHLNGYTHAALEWNVPTCVVAHSCVLSWWRAVKGHAAPEQWSRYRQLVSAGLHAADVVIAPSRAMLTALEREYGSIPGARIVHNARSTDQLPISSAHQATKVPLVLSVGRLWDEAKNVGAVEAIAPMLEWPVYIAGEADAPRGGPGYAISASGCAHHLGRLDSAAMATWMAHASIYALPATYEPFGLSVLEAALAGCALVLGDIPSLRELWDGAAVFVAPRDTAALVAQLQSLIADDLLRARVSDACHARALTFNVEQMAGGYMTTYRDMLHSARPAPRRVACA